MRQIRPFLRDIKRTEHKHWNNKKVGALVRLLNSGKPEFVEAPVYVVKDDCDYLVYDGNSRVFLAQNGVITLENICLIETDKDLETVREMMQEIYWPGNTLDSVVNYLRSRVYLMERGFARIDFKSAGQIHVGDHSLL